MTSFRTTAVVLIAALGAAESAGFATQEEKGPRARWERMSPEERARFEQNLDRWKQMDESQRKRMRQRLEKLRGMERRLEDSEDDDPTAGRDPPHGRDGSHPRAERYLRQRMECLPPEVRKRLREELSRLSPEERDRHLREIMKNESSHRMERRIAEWTRDGRLSRSEAEELKRILEHGSSAERFRALRQWMLNKPELFDLPPALVERLREVKDPVKAGRILDEWRRRRDGKAGDRPEGPPSRDRRHLSDKDESQGGSPRRG